MATFRRNNSVEEISYQKGIKILQYWVINFFAKIMVNMNLTEQTL